MNSRSPLPHESGDLRYNRIDIGPYFAYGVYPEADILQAAFDFSLKFGREWWGGDHKYERFTTSARFYTRRELVPSTRASPLPGPRGGNAPVQRKFGLAGAARSRTRNCFGSGARRRLGRSQLPSER